MALKQLRSQLLLLLVLELLPLRLDFPPDFTLLEPEILPLALQGAFQATWLGGSESCEARC